MRASGVPANAQHPAGSGRYLGPGSPKLDAERTKAVAAPGPIPGFARLLQFAGDTTYSVSADGLRSAFQPVRRGRELGEITRSIGCLDDPLGLGSTVAEFNEQRVDARGIVP